MAPPFEVAITH